MKNIFLLLLCLSAIFLQADNFRDGMIYYRNGDFKDAKISFEKSLTKDKTSLAYFMLGKMYLYGEGVISQRDKAIKYLENSVKNGNLRAKCYLAEAYLKNNTNKDEAIKLLNDGAKRNLKECKRIARIYNIITVGKVKK